MCLAGYSFEMRILILLYFLCDMINNTCLQIARGLGDNFSYAIGSIVGSLGKVALTVVGVSLLDGGLSVFTTMFYGHSILRPSCYECPYKSVMHPGDITIADYWGIEKAAPQFDDNKGVSLVLINNEVGERVFEKVKEEIKWKETRLSDSMQPPLKAPFPEPENRALFWSDFSNRSFDFIAKKYAESGLVNKVKRGLKKIKRKLIG